MVVDPREPVAKISYPWHPFHGAYMAPVPEVAAVSAITIANQIPPDLLANIPANQRQAYIDQWPLMNAVDRLALAQHYQTNSPSPPVATASPAEAQAMNEHELSQIPAAQQSYRRNNWAALTSIPAWLLARVPAADAPTYASQWGLLNPDERIVLAQTYAPDTGPGYGAPAGSTALAGILEGGSGLLLLGLAVGAWFLLRKN